MAERRMFAKTIIDSDAFLDMPLSTQALYFHLSMRADDEGFINNAKKIQRMIGASQDDLKLLIAKSFVIPFDTGIVVIKHWKIHNYIRADRAKATMYQDEKALLNTDENDTYSLALPTDNQVATTCQPTDNQVATTCQPTDNQVAAQDRIGKDSIGKVRIDYNRVATLFNSICTSLPQIRSLTDARRKKIKARLQTFSMEDIETAFRKAQESDFMTGKVNDWQASFDWIMNSDSNITKILEGNYDNRQGKQTDNKNTGMDPSDYTVLDGLFN